MKKFFLTIFVFSILTFFCLPVFGQGYVSLETDITVQDNIVYVNSFGYAEADNMFVFASVNENFSQVYGGLTFSADELSVGLGAGVTNKNNLRTSFFASWTKKHYSFSAVGETNLLDEEIIDSSFYQVKFLVYSPKSVLRAGWFFRKFNGFGPLLEFNFGSHLTIWSSPGMYDILETGNISSMFGLKFQN